MAQCTGRPQMPNKPEGHGPGTTHNETVGKAGNHGERDMSTRITSSGWRVCAGIATSRPAFGWISWPRAMWGLVLQSQQAKGAMLRPNADKNSISGQCSRAKRAESRCHWHLRGLAHGLVVCTTPCQHSTCLPGVGRNTPPVNAETAEDDDGKARILQPSAAYG